MIPKTLLRRLAGASLLFLLASPAIGETSPEAQKWLEKLVSIYDQGPFKVNYDAKLDLTAIGQPISGALKGNLTQGDRTHSRMEMEMEMGGIPGMSAEPIIMRMFSVTDGTITWSEIDNPAMGKQVTKIALADIQKIGQAMGGMSPASMDLVSQIETMTETMNFEILKREDGQVTLRGEMTEKARAQLGALAGQGAEAFLFVIDEKTGFPTEVRSEGEQPFLTMTFSGFERVSASSLPEGIFEYTPPEGTAVMDLGAMLQAQASQ